MIHKHLPDNITPDDREYGEAFFNSIATGGSDVTGYNGIFQDFEINRAYGSGVQDTSKFQQQLDMGGKENYNNFDWSPIPIGANFVDIILNSISNNDFKPTARAIDVFSNQLKEEELAREKARIILKDFNKDVNTLLGIETTPDAANAPQSLEEFDIYENLEYQQGVELAIEEALALALHIGDYKSEERKLLRDLIENKLICGKIVDTKEGPKFQYVDIEDLILPDTKDFDFRDAPYIAERKLMTIGELMRVKNLELTAEDWKSIVESATGSTTDGFADRYKVRNFNISQLGDFYDYKVSVITGYFKAIKNLPVYETGGDNKYTKVAKSERQDAKMMPYETIYEGIYVEGCKKLVKYKESDVVHRKKSNISECVFPFVIKRLTGRSLISSVIPYIDAIQISMLKLQQLKLKLKPSGYVINVNALASGLRGQNAIVEGMKILEQTGNVFINQAANLQGTTPPVSPLDDSYYLQKAQGLWDDIQRNLEFIRIATGVSEQRDGTETAVRATIGAQKAMLDASSNVTRHYEDCYIRFYEEVLTKLAIFIQDAVADDDSYFKNSLTQKTKDIIDTTKNFYLADFGIFMEHGENLEEEEYLKELISQAVANQEIRIDDAIQIRAMKNLKARSAMLRVKMKRKREEDQQMQMQMQNAQAQAQTQAMQQAAEIKAQEANADAQAKMQLDNNKFQLDQQMKQIEHQFAMELEALKSKNRIEEIKIDDELQGNNEQTRPRG